MDVCYQALANAIVAQAADDYRDTCYRLFKCRHLLDPVALATRIDLDRFFNSSWYELLTDVDSGYLIKRLRFEIVKNFKKKSVWTISISDIWYIFKCGGGDDERDEDLD